MFSEEKEQTKQHAHTHVRAHARTPENRHST